MQKDLLLRNLSAFTPSSLLEANAEFFKKSMANTPSNARRKQKGAKLPHYYKGISRDNNGQAVIQFDIESEGSVAARNANQNAKPKYYQCYIGIVIPDTTLFALANGTRKMADRVKILKNADVKCFCSCPDFNWSGAKYNMKHIHDSYAEGHNASNQKDDGGEDINPIHRDPQHKNMLCKHLYSALAGLLPNAPMIMRDARTAKFAPMVTPGSEADKKVKEAEQSNQNEVKSGYTDTSPAEKITPQTPENVTEALNESAPIKTEETQQALNDLSTGLESGYTYDSPNSETVSADQSTDSQNSGYDYDNTSEHAHPGNEEQQANKEAVPQQEQPVPNNMADIPQESQLDMFNVPLDEDDNQENND